MSRMIISGGGTAGHINPALSIAAELKDLGWEIHYIGNRNSLEERLITQAGYEFHPINIQKIYRKFTFAHLKFPFKLIHSIYTSYKIMKKIKPVLYLGTGGFVCGPGGLTAHLMHIPLVLQEQNSYPGLTTRLLAKWSEMTFLGNKNASKYINSSKSIFVGNPVRKDIFLTNTQANCTKYGLRPDTKKVFLLGGSQGSLKLNQNLSPIISELLANDIEIIWQTGRYSFRKFNEKFSHIKGVYIFDFTQDIAELYNLADIVIARSGALTLAELETLHKPAILVPLPTAAADHQLFNARELAAKGEAEIIEQKELTPERLLKKIILMMKNIKKYQNNFGSSPHQDSALKIAQIITKTWGRE